MRLTHLLRTALFLMAFLFAGIFPVMAQTVTNPPVNDPQVSPKTPNQSDFGTYGINGIDHYTGTAKISIPFYEINYKGLTIPIGIHYSSSGVKVNQRASDVGLGWNLAAGGSITRTKKGRPDDMPNGSLYKVRNSMGSDISTLTQDCNTVSSSGNVSKMYDITQGINDVEPDLFSYNFPGYSGQFYFSGSTIVPVESNDLKFEYEMEVNGGGTKKDLRNFVVTTPDGVKYYFGWVDGLASNGWFEQSSHRDMFTLEAISGYVYASGFMPDVPKALLYTERQNLWTSGGPTSDEALGTRNAWNLAKIVFPDNPAEQVIRFSYRTEVYKTYIETGEKFMPPSNLPENDEFVYRSFITPTVVSGVLSGISWPGGSIGFSYDSSRRDQFELRPDLSEPSGIKKLNVFSYAGAASSLNNVSIYGKDGVLQKRFLLGHSYFNLGQGPLYERLMLKSVTETGSDGRYNPPHVFSYYKSDSLPSILSDMQDYWGYYKKLSVLHKKPALVDLRSSVFNNLSFHYLTFPSKYLMMYPGASASYYTGLYGVDRSASLEETKTGALVEIQLPTGGVDSFLYELNRFTLLSVSYSGSTLAPVIDGAGLRVKKIKVKISTQPGDHDEDLVEEYSYSTGRVFSVPQFTKSWYLNPFRTDDTTRLTVFSSPVNGFATSKGSIVGYDQVTVTNKEKGSTSYEFFIPLSTSRSIANSGDINLVNAYDAPELCMYDVAPMGYLIADRLDLYPYPSGPSLDWASGMPVLETVKSHSGRTVKQTIYNYTTYAESKAYAGVSLQVINDERFVDGLGVTTGNVYNYYRYYYLRGWRPLTEKTERLYDMVDTLRYSNNTTTYNYNTSTGGNHLPATITRTNSDGSYSRQQFRYVSHQDFSAYVGGGLDEEALDYFRDHHMLTPLVEQVDLVKAAGELTYKVTGATFNRYKKFGNSPTLHVYPWDVHTLATTLPLSDFVPCSLSVGDQALVFDSRYVPRITYEKYDAYGNLSQYSSRAKARTSMKYDEYGLNPVAVFENAATSFDVLGNESGYLDFESHKIDTTAIPENDYWDLSGSNIALSSTAFSGKYSLEVMSGKHLNRCFLPDDQQGRYRVSAWVKLKNTSPGGPGLLVLRVASANSGDCESDNDFGKESPDRIEVDFSANDTVWTYVEANMDLSLARDFINTSDELFFNCYVWNDLGESFYMDNIRVQPIPSAVRSFTYDHAQRVTSISDEAGKTEHYEYDSFGRLSLIRDTFKNIVKSFYYTYSNR
jgi:YD repeat-containing protein